jgi:hypothetical protein
VRDLVAAAEARTCLAMEAMSAVPRDARAQLDAARGALTALRRVPLVAYGDGEYCPCVHDTLLSWAHHAAGLALVLLGAESAGAVAHLRMAVAASERAAKTAAAGAAAEQNRIVAAAAAAAGDAPSAPAPAEASHADAAPEQQQAASEADAAAAVAEAAAPAAPRMPGMTRLGHHLMMLAQVLVNALEVDEARAVLARLEALPAEDSVADAAACACMCDPR